MSELQRDIDARRTFAIISHPDAGKTTMTEKLLLLGQAIQVAGSVKGKRGPHATSDWMALEQERGISVTSSVMQFPYKERWVNLLDTPGHEDFSEDTYRTLTAVDSALMVIDGAKGVEDRTVKLMNVCRLRDTPIMTFVNKLDRLGANFYRVVDQVRDVLGANPLVMTLPIGEEDNFTGIVDVLEEKAWIWDDSGDPEAYKIVDVPEDLKDKTSEYRDAFPIDDVVGFDAAPVIIVVQRRKVVMNQ